MQEEPRGKGLERLGSILERRQSEMVGLSSEKRKETRTEECKCKTCGNTFEGEVTTYYYFDPPREIRPGECPQCREAREAEEKKAEEAEKKAEEAEHTRKIERLRQSWRENCGLPQQFQGMRFQDLDPDYQPKAQKLCRQWAENFDVERPRESRSLLLYSPGPGVGKSLLMSCIANHIIDNWHGDLRDNCPIAFVSGPGLVRRIRATFGREFSEQHEREEDVYNELSGVSLLMLDDVGKEQPRTYRFTQEVYWYIIDERVKTGLPVVINSRLPLTGEDSLEQLMGVDTVDRLYGMTGGQMIKITGPSYRKLKKIP